jgi:2-polyprenyl-3-methyl-5-hydroxy-6-metoxy-1,4-benzoquinol methylase
MVLKKDINGLYKGSGLLTKLYLRTKLRICPFLLMEEFFPKTGKMVDLGCGNGLFSFILKLGSPSREIVGFDLDEKKINVARAIQKAFTGIQFEVRNIVGMRYPEADVLTLIDVLYLIPFAKQEEILEKCSGTLKAGGWLILKDMDTKPRWKYGWNIFQETLAVKIIGFTLGEKFYFRSREDYSNLLTSLGFQVKAVSLDKGYWYPHILYICQKR